MAAPRTTAVEAYLARRHGSASRLLVRYQPAGQREEGHPYGTGLDPRAKADLLAYLKTF